jgi:hypothetical protein
MRHNLILTGDINLLGVTDPTIPFARIRDRLHEATEDGVLSRAAFSFVRHNAQNETIPRPIAAEEPELDHLRHLSARFGTRLEVEGDEVVVWPKP